MIANLKPYAEYKASGSRWLKSVPSHWDVRNLRTLIRPKNERNRADLPLLSVAREKGVFVRSLTDDDENHNVIPEDLSNYKVARAGDLVINKMKAWQGSMGIAPVDGIVSPAYFVYEFAVASQTFGQVLLRSKPYVSHFAQASDGVRVGQWDLTISGMRAIPVLLPPPDEQAAIVRFLDWANGRLERAIRAKRKVIALLGEQKQAIIHRAVTRGLDPAVPLKPSGIPWLGDIPQHWKVERTKNVFRLRIEKSGVAHGKELLSIYTHIGVRPRKDLEQKGNKASTTDNYWIVRKGDLIVNKLLAWMGAVGVSDYEGVTSPAYDILMPIRPLCSDYYHHLFRTKLYLQMFRQRSRGIMEMRLRLYFDQLGQIPVPIPPIDEQASIVAFYLEETADLSTTIFRLAREIELLREYRTRLVADVVTGKLNVRQAASRLPDDAPLEANEFDADLNDEPEAEDEESPV